MASEAVALEWAEWPRIPVRGFLGYGLSGAFHVRDESRGVEVDPDEQHAIEAAKQGDPDAFDVLVRRYSRRVLSIVWNVVHDAAAAEDITQDAFVKAYESIRRFRTGERFGPWIYRIATNLAIDSLRRKARRGEAPIDENVEATHLVRPDELTDRAKRIDDALESLPEMQRIVARLALVEELSYAEIAEMTGLAEGTVRSHLSLARKKLQEILRDLYGG